jgi:poly(ADP-ribose) glycohydrolase ARH3
VKGTVADRLAGALLGTALGDAVGAPFEGMARPAPEAIAAHLRSESPLRWTDDTHMMLALAESMAATGGRVEPQQLGETFARYFHDQPWRGLRRRTAAGVRAGARTSWLRPSLHGHRRG